MGRSKKRSRASSSRLNPLRKAGSDSDNKDANVVNKKLASTFTAKSIECGAK